MVGCVVEWERVSQRFRGEVCDDRCGKLLAGECGFGVECVRWPLATLDGLDRRVQDRRLVTKENHTSPGLDWNPRGRQLYPGSIVQQPLSSSSPSAKGTPGSGNLGEGPILVSRTLEVCNR